MNKEQWNEPRVERINNATEPLVGSGDEACRGGANEYAL